MLLAELVGWAPYLPIMLDMASRPADSSYIRYTHTDRWGYGLTGIWGGFKALEVLSSEYRGVSKCRESMKI